MQVIHRLYARERPFERQVFAEKHDLCLMQVPEWRNDAEGLVVDAYPDSLGEGTEESRGGIRKRIRFQYPQGQLMDAMQVAPEQTLQGEKQVTSWQVDRFIRGGCIRHIFA